jgi:hypothetical protein
VGKRPENAARADLDFALDDRERTNKDVAGNLGLTGNDGRGMNPFPIHKDRLASLLDFGGHAEESSGSDSIINNQNDPGRPARKALSI